MTLSQQITEARARLHAFIDGLAEQAYRELRAMVIRDNRSLGQRIRWITNPKGNK